LAGGSALRAPTGGLPPHLGGGAMSTTSTTPDLVTLREITEDTVVSIVKLSVAESQMHFVAPNAVSLAQALFSKEAWYRAIYRGEEPVGFVMLYDESLRTPPPEAPNVGVWRFMVDARHQGRGIGRQALAQVLDHVRGKGVFTSLELSYVPGPNCPEPFYLSMGFRHTGRMDGDEVVLELAL
jgi:diamine N-acetyltransferase